MAGEEQQCAREQAGSFRPAWTVFNPTSVAAAEALADKNRTIAQLSAALEAARNRGALAEMAADNLRRQLRAAKVRDGRESPRLSPGLRWAPEMGQVVSYPPFAGAEGHGVARQLAWVAAVREPTPAVRAAAQLQDAGRAGGRADRRLQQGENGGWGLDADSPPLARVGGVLRGLASASLSNLPCHILPFRRRSWAACLSAWLPRCERGRRSPLSTTRSSSTWSKRSTAGTCRRLRWRHGERHGRVSCSSSMRVASQSACGTVVALSSHSVL